MRAFLAPVPILHVQSMLEDLKKGQRRFAFGSMAMNFFENIAQNCEGEKIDAYIYVSKAGEGRVDSKADKQLGVFVRGRLCGWVMGDRRGLYPKSGLAKRPESALTDGPMTLFWEIDDVERLDDRIQMSHFLSASTSKPLVDDFVPQGPIWVTADTQSHRKMA